MVASVFGKHVHPTGHCAPIMVLSGSGMPEFVVVETEGLGDRLYSIIEAVATKSTSEIIKRKMANPSI
jgi:hypothetical protein